MPEYVYLDQNAWICLLKEKEGRSHDPQVRHSLETVEEMSESEKAKFPISTAHLEETSKIRDNARRVKLWQFIISLSKGNAIAPISLILTDEIRNAVRHRNGLPTMDLTRRVFGKGLPFILGLDTEDFLRGEEVRSLSSERKKKLAFLEGPEMLLQAIKDKPSADRERSFRRISIETQQKLEKLRRVDEKTRSKTERHNAHMKRYIRDLIIPEMEKEMGILRKGWVTILPEHSTMEDVEELLKSMPTHYANWLLTFRRDIQFFRDVDENDLLDICTLAPAIAYCDIVVTEKFFGSIARDAKLGKLYDTVILSSPKELYSYLPR